MPSVHYWKGGYEVGGASPSDPTVKENWVQFNGSTSLAVPTNTDVINFDDKAEHPCIFTGTFPASGTLGGIIVDKTFSASIGTGGTTTINTGGLTAGATSFLDADHALKFDFISAPTTTGFDGAGVSFTSGKSHVYYTFNSGSIFLDDTSRQNTTFDFNAYTITLMDGVYPKIEGTGSIYAKKTYKDNARTEFNTYGSVDMWTITGDINFIADDYDIYDYEKIFYFEGGFTALGTNFKFGHTTARFKTYRSSGTGSVVFPVTGELNSTAFGNDTNKTFYTQYHKVIIESNDNTANYWLVSSGKVLECNELVVNDGGRFYGPVSGTNAVVIRSVKRPTIYGDWNFRQVTDGIYESIGGTNVLPVTHGGTGLTTIPPGAILYGDGQGNLQVLTIGSTGQTLKVHSSGVPYWSS